MYVHVHLTTDTVHTLFHHVFQPKNMTHGLSPVVEFSKPLVVSGWANFF
jgi:hypothetical protein